MSRSGASGLGKPVGSPLEGLVFQKVLADGNCFYQAVALSIAQASPLPGCVPQTEDQASLRGCAAKYIEENRGEFRNFLPDKEIVSDLISKIREKAWADQVAIHALTLALKRPIIVIQSDVPPVIPSESILKRLPGDPIFVFYNGRDHYDAFLVGPSAKPKNILEDINFALAYELPVTYSDTQLSGHLAEKLLVTKAPPAQSVPFPAAPEVFSDISVKEELGTENPATAAISKHPFVGKVSRPLQGLVCIPVSDDYEEPYYAVALCVSSCSEINNPEHEKMAFELKKKVLYRIESSERTNCASLFSCCVSVPEEQMKLENKGNLDANDRRILFELMEFLRRPIIIIRKTEDPIIPTQSELKQFPGNPIFILRGDGRIFAGIRYYHYDALLMADSRHLKDILARIRSAKILGQIVTGSEEYGVLFPSVPCSSKPTRDLGAPKNSVGVGGRL